MGLSGSANAALDGRIDWNGTFAQLVAAFPTPKIPVGVTAYTTDLGRVNWNGSYWECDTAIDGITANAGGVQANATLLTGGMNRVPNVGGAGYSVALPASAPGMNILVTNAHASNSLNVFPNAGGTTTETINALSANAAFALGAGKSATFVCYTAGQWHTVPLVP